MDNKMAVFNNREFGSIRVIEQNGKYLFCGSDVAKALGYAIPTKAVNTHCKGVSKMETPTAGGIQKLLFITEGDVYRLIVHSRLPGAERFEKWVFDEVLPMIRKTGGYMTASLLEQAAEKPEILLAFADQLLAEHEKNRQLSGEVERLRPKADFYDAFVHEENCTNIRATAKELQIGERAFCRFLMDAGFLYRCPAGYLLPYIRQSPSSAGRHRSALSGAGPSSVPSVPFPRRSHRTSPGYFVFGLPSWYLASFRIRVWDVPNKHFSGLGGGFPKAKNRKRVLACCACYRYSSRTLVIRKRKIWLPPGKKKRRKHIRLQRLSVPIQLYREHYSSPSVLASKMACAVAMRICISLSVSSFTKASSWRHAVDFPPSVFPKRIWSTEI